MTGSGQRVQQLSSHMSFAYKFLLLPAVTGLFAYDLAASAINSGRADWVGVAVWLVLVVWFWTMLGRLKRVRFDGTQLWVSNWRREIVIPVGDILEVDQQKWLSTSPVTITLASRSDFGESIHYMPPFSVGMWGEDPEVAMLREAAIASRAASA